MPCFAAPTRWLVCSGHHAVVLATFRSSRRRRRPGGSAKIHPHWSSSTNRFSGSKKRKGCLRPSAFARSASPHQNQSRARAVEITPPGMAAGDAEEALQNPGEKVPSMEHNKKIIGESLDLIKYIDSELEGPKLITNVTMAMLEGVRSKRTMTAEAGKN